MLRPVQKAVRILERNHDWSLICEQRVSCSVTKTFPFFATARNLERLTPPFLKFRIRHITSEPLTAGAIIDYSLRLHHIPIRWRSQIEQWEPPHRFIDYQIRGPFKLRRHTHTFRADGNDTIITDTVQFNLYCRTLKHTPVLTWIHDDLKTIFEFRQREIVRVFENGFERAETPSVLISSPPHA